jgi:rRNA maturation RNase YbeY
MIEFAVIDKEVPGLDPELFVSALSELIKKEGAEVGSITIVTCSDEHLLSMNKKYLDHDYYTDIITFDYTSGRLISGDLFISVDRVADNATMFTVDFMREFKRVCAHGILHLCGYKDKTEDDAAEMRLKEEEALLLFCST